MFTFKYLIDNEGAYMHHSLDHDNRRHHYYYYYHSHLNTHRYRADVSWLLFTVQIVFAGRCWADD